MGGPADGCVYVIVLLVRMLYYYGLVLSKYEVSGGRSRRLSRPRDLVHNIS